MGGKLNTAVDFLSKNAFQLFFFVISIVGTVATMAGLGVSLPWILVSLLGIFSLFLLANLVRLWNRPPDVDVLLFHFILPTDGIKPFYNLLIDSAAKSLEKLADRNWLLVPRIPANSFDKLDIWQKYGGVAALKKITGGILLLADDPDENFETIIDTSQNTEIPIVMVDVYFDPAGYDDRNREKMPCFVGGDELVGGQLAAEILIDRVREKCASNESQSKIVIIKGGNTAWELQRISAFKKTVTDALGCSYVETEFLYYHRDDAFDVVYRLFASFSPEDILGCVGIFAANDDMAIGARNAIRELNKIRSVPIKVSIVGYDGTPEMKNLIQRGDEFLVGTIDVKIKEQGESAIYLMKKLAEGERPKTKVNLITPQKYINVNL